MNGSVNVPGASAADLALVKKTADDAAALAQKALDATGSMTISVVPSQSGTLTYTGNSQSPIWSGYDSSKMTLGGATSGTNAGTYTATFTPTANYKWSDGSTTAKTVSWSIGKAAISTTPSQSGSLTYTGNAQSPQWSSYSTAQLTIGGATSATNAGTYTATFTPTGNYKWSDGSTYAKSVSWSIGKAAISTTPSQSGSLTYTGNVQSPQWSSYSTAQLTIGGATSATNAGTYTATFTPTGNYRWSDGSTAAKSANWSIGKASISATPSQSGTLTYTGNAQIPQWSSYSTAQLTIGGVTFGTNAGSYNATFTPTANYKWSNGSTTAKSVSWSIGKAAGSLTLNKTTMTLNVITKSSTITVTRAGDGAVTATSSNTGIAAVSVSGNVVTVTGKAYGAATITVNVAAGTNHTAPASKTCSVSVNIFSTTLNSNTWAQIKAASDAGEGANCWAVGDTKTITINGRVGGFTFSKLSIDAFILGFNHNSSREGTGRIHFQIGKINGVDVSLCDGSYGGSSTISGAFTMNTGISNSGGWNSSHMRKTLLGSNSTPTSPTANTLLAALPSDLRAVMKPVTKYSDNTGGGSNHASYVTATTDYLWLLSEFEVFGVRSYANSAEQNYQAQYEYYKAGNSKIKYKHNATGTEAAWWLRSVMASGIGHFCHVITDGSAGFGDAHRSYGVPPGFAA